MYGCSILNLLTIQPPLCQFIRSFLIFDVVEIHLIEQNTDGDLTLDPMKVGKGKSKYLMINLDRLTHPIAIERKIGKVSLIEYSIFESINIQMEKLLVQLHLVLLVLALQQFGNVVQLTPP